MNVARLLVMVLSMSVACVGIVRADVPEEVVDLPTRGDVERILYLQPAQPVANLVMLPGGNGVLKLRPDGTGESDWFTASALARERQRFAAQGLAVAIVDAPLNWQDSVGLGPYRQSGAHYADVLEVIRYMRKRADVPVWLVGHSNGAISAMYVARELPPEQPAGVVLVAGATGDLINMNLRTFTRPVLVVSHENDPCSGIYGQTRMFDEFISAPAKQHVVLVGGNSSTTSSCTSGYHQFEGLGAELVAPIAAFVRQYNALVALPVTTASAVEYYHAGLDHYFLTWVDAEAAKLDAGSELKGWVRTGASVRVWVGARADTSPVCRFYIPPQWGDSHFYGRGTAECDATAAANPGFVLEDPQFMHVVLPVEGACPAGTVPVYRVFSNRVDANHRYTTDRATRDGMVAAGWLAEGDGPDLVVMCAAP